MRKIGLTILLLLTVPNLEAADFGLKLGGNLSKLNFDPDFGHNKRIVFGLQAAAVISFELNSSFGLRIEPGYTCRGYMYDLPTFAPPSDFRQRLSYIDLPILLRWSLTTLTEAIAPFITLGPYGAWLIDANLSNGDAHFENTESFRRFDWGIMVGTGLNVPLNNHNLLIEVRYTHGLNNISSEETLAIYNQSVSLSFSYIL